MFSPQNGREPSRKPDKKSQQIDEMLKAVLGTIPEAPLDMIGATPRNNEMGKKFNMADMHLPHKHKYLPGLPLNLPGPLSPPKSLPNNLKPPKVDSPPLPVPQPQSQQAPIELQT